MPKVLKETREQAFSCVSELGPEVANASRIRDEKQLPEDNSVVDQLWGCVWEKKGIVDKQGVVYPEKLRAYLVDVISIVPLPPKVDIKSIADKITERCKDMEGRDYKQKSVKMQNCVIKEAWNIDNQSKD
ncbi:hypothetical protein ILUMI_20939 [Ignelater luminosus]|uniref:Uncharacterized protein n=1 Tax=Ignelater luminosus TaxID=2038154 RepID=A0A8K0CJU5_IGNLU|nr:hypothetical protein ILUMI_20939 [Ignelater luminosus]